MNKRNHIRSRLIHIPLSRQFIKDFLIGEVNNERTRNSSSSTVNRFGKKKNWMDAPSSHELVDQAKMKTQMDQELGP